MNDKEFWDLIAWANAQGDHPDERQDAIEHALAELPPERIEDFYLAYDRFVTAAWTSDVAVLTYLVNCYGTRSGYEYLLGFICWLIDAGPVVYHAALTDPERLADVEKDQDPPWDSEGYWRNASWAWQIATEKDERAFYDRVGERGSTGAQEYPGGRSVEDDDLRRLWPRLCKRFIDERPYEDF